MEVRELQTRSLPLQLREIPQPPKRLWMRGSWPATDTKYLAVVGSRALTSYGREAVAMLIGGLSGYPVSVVSGLALGTDAAAHRAALSAGLHTVAIPGSGLDDTVIGPRTNLPLARDILASGGALLSEHEPTYAAHPYDFPSRNRLMVGLADAVLVVEAGERSGTLITARLAGEYNRELLCVPHRIGDPHGFGAHIFLRLGATMVTEPQHLLEALRIASDETLKETRPEPQDLSNAEQAVYALLENPLPRDELVRNAKLPAHEALSALVSLELRGLLKEEFGAWRRV
ncbi:MAG: hypothetical protein B7X04_03035 [Parcubacteria group bacterium 21-54-25]|nr:MAG: hypothetical protein B7X04_03035 [Parcubacteria group bacterium 21-54-25]HQU07927.1 DNA-protecting protein DprA [Candidatus Paceibacterota bacterium]